MIEEEHTMRSAALALLVREFGAPARDVSKVKSWNVSGRVGIVVQTDQPAQGDAALIWVPHPGDDQPIPEFAIEYPAEAGRHSGTYPALGLEKGNPALKLVARTLSQIDDVVAFVKTMALGFAVPAFKHDESRADREDVTKLKEEHSCKGTTIDPATMPKAESKKPRREAIPRLIQREVWQRDGGACVECGKREQLCFDHIVPFSKGGSNSVRNLQLLCEKCNSAKGNRI